MESAFIALLAKSKSSKRRFLLDSATVKQLQPLADFIIKVNAWGIVLTSYERKLLKPYKHALKSIIKGNSKLNSLLIQYDELIPKLFEIYIRHR